jgi:hypothetical protein
MPLQIAAKSSHGRPEYSGRPFFATAQLDRFVVEKDE